MDPYIKYVFLKSIERFLDKKHSQEKAKDSMLTNMYRALNMNREDVFEEFMRRYEESFLEQLLKEKCAVDFLKEEPLTYNVPKVTFVTLTKDEERTIRDFGYVPRTNDVKTCKVCDLTIRISNFHKIFTPDGKSTYHSSVCKYCEK